MVGIHKLAAALFSGAMKGHFGQWAEDVLIRKLFDKNKKDGIYLDIGAYHPFTHSNTAYFWMKGWTGINIDANLNTIKLFQKIRPTDKNIWTAIVPQKAYQNGMHEVTLMLPSKADHTTGIAATGTVVDTVGTQRGFSDTQQVPAISVAALIAKENIQSIDYLNIDIEGYDEAILEELDFSSLTPTVVSIEDYSGSFAELVDSQITRLMKKNRYELAGRAGPTSIFLRYE